jgi:hypothetical protein
MRTSCVNVLSAKLRAGRSMSCVPVVLASVRLACRSASCVRTLFTFSIFVLLSGCVSSEDAYHLKALQEK